MKNSFVPQIHHSWLPPVLEAGNMVFQYSFRETAWIGTQSPLLLSCVKLNKSLNLSVPQFLISYD